MGVHGQVFVSQSEVAQFRERLFRQPQIFLFEQAPMSGDNPAVNTTAVQVQRVARFLIQFARNDIDANHLTSRLSANSRTAISIIAAWDTPSFFASSLSKRFASGVKRMLVDSLFDITQLYRICNNNAITNDYNSLAILQPWLKPFDKPAYQHGLKSGGLRQVNSGHSLISFAFNTCGST